MPCWYAIVQKLRPGCGRSQDKTYVNVVDRTGNSPDTFAAVIANPPWNNPENPEFIVEITQQEFYDFTNGTNPRYHSEFGNLPRWQQETAGLKSFGSFADPQIASGFTVGLPLPDDRWIVRIFDGDPGVAGVHIATLDLDEGQDAGRKVMYLKLYDENDIPSTTNAQNRKTEIAGKRMIFDFTSGVSTFGIKTIIQPGGGGDVIFPSNHVYRVVGPSGESIFTAQIYGRDIEAAA